MGDSNHELSTINMFSLKNVVIHPSSVPKVTVVEECS